MKQYTLKNANGMEVVIGAHGARIASVNIPVDGQLLDITVSYDTVEEYETKDHYLSAICGRVCNRIANGKFTLEGVDYQLPTNNETNHLHGGPEGFSTRFWNLEEVVVAGAASACKCSIVSADGDQGYPGKVEVAVTYSLTNENELRLDMVGTTDKTTLMNLTSHPYFNLKGIANGDVLDHTFQVNAKEFTPLGDTGTTSGEIRSVEGTAMDLREGQVLADVMSADYEQIQRCGGIDHNWLIDKPVGEMAFAAKLAHPATGRSVEVYSTQPGFQAYGAMHMDGSETGKNGTPFNKACGFALEAQGVPNAINCEKFPSVVLKPEDKYEEVIVFKFKF